MTWANSLVVILGDHETGFLTAGLEADPSAPILDVSTGTLAMERRDPDGTRASW